MYSIVLAPSSASLCQIEKRPPLIFVPLMSCPIEQKPFGKYKFERASIPQYGPKFGEISIELPPNYSVGRYTRDTSETVCQPNANMDNFQECTRDGE